MVETLLAYHGTTRARARGIFDQGFLPKPPLRRVWFAEDRAYAMGRAKTQARRANDTPIVFACDLNLGELRRQLGRKNVVYKRGIIAIDGPLPASALREFPFADMATVPREVAAWVNDLFDLEPDEGVKPEHPGLVRLSRWINSCLASDPESKLLCSELLERARRWLPEYFVQADLDEPALRAHRRVGLIDYEVDTRVLEPDPREDEAFGLMDAPDPAERVRGIKLLAAIHEPDLFDWCAMYLDDEAADVQAAALHTMSGCPDGAPEVVEPFAASENRHVRAAPSPRWRGTRETTRRAGSSAGSVIPSHACESRRCRSSPGWIPIRIGRFSTWRSRTPTPTSPSGRRSCWWPGAAADRSGRDPEKPETRTPCERLRTRKGIHATLFWET